MKTKWRFEIVYVNQKMKNINQKMKYLFPEFEDIGAIDIIVFDSESDADVETVKADLRSCYEKEEVEIVSIIGGKLE